MGMNLLKLFQNLLGEERVYNLYDAHNFGPKKALEDYKNVDNLRIIGKYVLGSDGYGQGFFGHGYRQGFSPMPYGMPHILGGFVGMARVVISAFLLLSKERCYK